MAAARKVRIACRNSEGAWVMKVVHRIGFRASGEQRLALEALGVKLPSAVSLPEGGEPLLTFDVDENHPNWSLLSALFDGWNVFNMVRTEFTKKELESARWLEVGAWHHGYPQPHDEEFGYLQATYDLTDWCESCGIGMKQKAPFQMKREPKWGATRSCSSSGCTTSSLLLPMPGFAPSSPQAWGCRPVLNTKGVELKTVVQLVVETRVGIVTNGLAFERCERCGRTKYLPVTRGAFPALRDVPTASLVRTAEYFGSGGQADQRVLMSQDVARALNAAGVRGAVLKPVTEL
ncbi:MAG: hypothetical protein IPK71_11870 [Myxococcales bacterium]|nr:hypothetical protein [Myxococcales bacterium]